MDSYLSIKWRAIINLQNWLNENYYILAFCQLIDLLNLKSISDTGHFWSQFDFWGVTLTHHKEQLGIIFFAFTFTFIQVSLRGFIYNLSDPLSDFFSMILPLLPNLRNYPCKNHFSTTDENNTQVNDPCFSASVLSWLIEKIPSRKIFVSLKCQVLVFVAVKIRNFSLNLAVLYWCVKMLNVACLVPPRHENIRWDKTELKV